MADAVNPQSIVSGVYTGIVKAANPTGLLPNLDPYINSSVVKQYGFSYNPGKAKTLLKESGYKGQKLTLEVPDGWTDWMAAIQIISQHLNAVGIQVSPIYPSANDRTADETSGNYDMMIDNNAGARLDPWSYFDHVYQLPIGGANNEEAPGSTSSVTATPARGPWSRRQPTHPRANTAALDEHLQPDRDTVPPDLPEIPLWYNGAWFQGNDTYWSNYPSSDQPQGPLHARSCGAVGSAP